MKKLITEIEKKAIFIRDRLEKTKRCFYHDVYGGKVCLPDRSCKDCNFIIIKEFLVKELISNLKNYS